ncbi:hypothetical protein OG596_01845 [Streptomyces sp. NBC_01102]|uniref:hypothetical protein n=1 Tax=unclassified Streptomyces TaxID=2593676 RepID=UPI00386CFD20|nr:hypothetical protein OG596_01845 [Streptomyces sp. NBC_01102]
MQTVDELNAEPGIHARHGGGECGRFGAMAVFLEGVWTLTLSENHQYRIPALRPHRALRLFTTVGA